MTPTDSEPGPAPAAADAPTRRPRSPLNRDGALLPDSTSDERDLVTRTSDDWYDSERPPHHG